MKTKLLLSTMLLAGWGLSAGAQETQKVSIPVSYDTWVTTGGTANRGGNNSLEIKRWVETVNEEEVAKNNIGLLGFNVTVPEGMKIQDATLYLLTERVKINPMCVYFYENDFAESNSYEQEGAYVEAAFNTTGVEFTANGQNGKAIFDGVDASYQSLDKWQNFIPVTSLLKGKTFNGRINFMIACDQSINVGASNGNDVRIYTKENQNGADVFKQSDNSFLTHIEADDITPRLELTFVEDSDTQKTAGTSLADTQIRWNNTNNFGGDANMEIYTRLAADDTANKKTFLGKDYQQLFFGLYRFGIPEDVLDTEKYEISNATLRLVCTQNKGDRYMEIYDYSNDFAENTTFANEEEYLVNALSAAPLATFSANGSGGWAMGDGSRLTDDTKTVEGWTNYIDVTEYLRNKALDGKNTFNILLKKKEDNASGSGNAMKFATKEAKDIQAKNGEEIVATFAAADLVPQLVVTYTKKETAGPDQPEDPEDPEVEGILPSADTWIMKNNDSNFGNLESMEVKTTYVDNSDERADEHYSLIRFENLPEDLLSFKVEKAELRLTTTMTKQSPTINVYNYGNDFNESTAMFADEEDHVREALSSQPIATFDANGQLGKAPQWDSVDADYQNVVAWQSYVDLTDYIAGIADKASSVSDLKFNLLLEKDGNFSEQTTFATKEANDITLNGTDIVFAKADLVPMLFITLGDEKEEDIVITPTDDQTVIYVDEDKIYVVTQNKSNVIINISAPEGTEAVYYQITLATTEDQNDEAEPISAGRRAVPAGYQTATPNGDGTFGITLAFGDEGKLDVVFADNDDQEIKNATYSYSVKAEAPTSVENVEVAAEGIIEYYNLQGVRVATPDHGIFIKIAGGKATKIVK